MGLRPSQDRRPALADPAVRAPCSPERFAPRRIFTLDQAIQSLVFLRPVVSDLREAFARACSCHARIHRDATMHPRSVIEQDRAIARFDRALDEIETVGAELLCCRTGLLAFPTLIESCLGRHIWSPAQDAWSQVCLLPRLHHIPASAAVQ